MKEKPSHSRLQSLAEKWLSGTITPEEAKEYADWYNEGQGNPIGVPEDFAANEKEQRDRILAGIQVKRVLQGETGNKQVTGKRFLIKTKRSYYKAAAALIVISLGITLYYTLYNKKTAPVFSKTALNHLADDSIRPGSDKAVLRLADGTLINLHQSQNGVLATQGGSQIVKTKQGQLIYQAKNGKQSLSTENLLSIPRGGKFALTLADGTKVWLNAASSLSYPCIFDGKQRVVTLTGEAYFEVAHDARHPFIVRTRGQNVEVLGTHFNINAYADEASVKTTLLEGKVNVSTSSNLDHQDLLPGQQSILSSNHLDKRKVNPAYAVAWQKGNFMFDNENIQSIMREIARWYDVNISYEGDIPDDEFAGTVSRFENVTQVLQILQLTGKVHFKIKGKQIIVSKQA